jgi:sulfoxide reductase heme-binding subunit YedZ
MIISKKTMHHGMLWLSLLPLVYLIYDIISLNLGSNPIEALHIRLGDWGLRFLLLTLAITPIQTISRWRGMSDFRQLFGLMAAFYATLHVIVYLVVDHALDGSLILADIIESRFIWLGILAYLILFFLALTSSKPAKKFMGKNWKKLHRMIYLGSGASILHYFWQLKGNLAEPLFYLLLLFLLLGFRVVDSYKAKLLVFKS